MTHPALKCLRKHIEYLSVQTGGKMSGYACYEDDGALAIGVSPVPVANGMSVKVEIVSEAVGFPSAQEFLRLLQSYFESNDIVLTQLSSTAIVLSLTISNVLRRSGHFIPSKLPVFLEEYNELLILVCELRSVLDYCTQCDQVDSDTLERCAMLTIYGVKQNVTVH